MRLRIVIRLTRCFVYEIAALRNRTNGNISLDAVKAFLDRLQIIREKKLTDGVFNVKPDQGFVLMDEDDEDEDGPCLSTCEDKGSPGLGKGGKIDLDTAQDGEIPNTSTLHAIQQVSSFSKHALCLMDYFRCIHR